VNRLGAQYRIAVMRALFACWLGLNFVVSAPAADHPAGAVVLQTGFEEEGVLRAWGAAGKPGIRLTEGCSSPRSLEVEVPAGTPGSATASLALPLDGLRGARVRCEAMIRARGVTDPPQPWNGVKCMLHIVAPGGDSWPQQNHVAGSFDWKKSQFVASIPPAATAASLILGLEAVCGSACFDDLKITVVRPPRVKPATPPAGPAFKGHELPRLRGAMIGTNLTDSDLREFGRDWGANHVRWQLLWGGFPHGPADQGDLAAYDAWLEGQLQRLDKLLPVCREAGLRVLIDLHTPPGGRDQAKNCRLFQQKRFQDNFLAWWERIAKRYRGQTTVWGYDLVNEPVEGELGEDCMTWQELATAAARVVRAHDPDHAIVVEPAPWGGPEAIANLDPIPVPGIVYSVHMYQPHQFTHQGVYDDPVGISYPGQAGGRHWDKQALRRALQPVRDFQRDFGVHIYLGEFSAIRWAPGDSACRYLSDCIDLFEEFGWDWAYHAFREWDGWSVEHGPDRNNHARAKETTDRAKLLRRWFAENLGRRG
jgi:hypothetical protein